MGHHQGIVTRHDTTAQHTIANRRPGEYISIMAKPRKTIETTTPSLDVQYIPIAKLKPWKDNPRHNDDAVDALVRSIERFGYTNPILIRRQNNEIIAGHTRVKALQKMGKTTVPCILLDLNDTDAHTYAIFDNKSVESVPWDFGKLKDVLAEMRQFDVDLESTGFSPAEIQMYLAEGLGDLFAPDDRPGKEAKPELCPHCGADITAALQEAD